MWLKIIESFLMSLSHTLFFRYNWLINYICCVVIWLLSNVIYWNCYHPQNMTFTTLRFYSGSSNIATSIQNICKQTTPTIGGSRISPRWGCQLSSGRQYMILPNVPKNCMKMKEFGPRGGGYSLLNSAQEHICNSVFHERIKTVCKCRLNSLYIIIWLMLKSFRSHDVMYLLKNLEFYSVFSFKSICKFK